MLASSGGGFSKISGDAKGVNLLSILKETRVFDKYVLWNNSRLHVLFIRKCAHENRGSSKQMISLFKNRVFSIWATTFCREFANSIVFGGHFSTIAPLISATASK